jgi:hypothetical protein
MVLGSRSARKFSAMMVEKHGLTIVVLRSYIFFWTSIVDENLLDTRWCHLISQYKSIRIFRCANTPFSIARLSVVEYPQGVYQPQVRFTFTVFWRGLIFSFLGCLLGVLSFLVWATLPLLTTEGAWVIFLGTSTLSCALTVGFQDLVTRIKWVNVSGKLFIIFCKFIIF